MRAHHITKTTGPELPVLVSFPGLSAAIDQATEIWGGRVFLHSLDDGRTVSFGDLRNAIAAYGSVFAAHHLKPGDTIATNSENSVDLIQLIIASLAHGMRIALIESQIPQARLDRFIEITNPRLAFGAMAGSAVNCVPWPNAGYGSKPLEEGGAVKFATTSGQDDAVVIFSSGTTGTPKGIVHSHANIQHELDSMIAAYDARNMVRHYLALPLSHASGLYRGLLMPMFTGGTVAFRQQFSTRQFWRDMEDCCIEFVQLVPSHVAMLNRSEEAPIRDVVLRMVGTASAYLPPAEQSAFEQRFGVPVLQGYGLTECTCGIALNSLDLSKRRMGGAGNALNVNRIRIVDTAGIEVEPGESGELQVKGPNVASKFLGYEGPQFDHGWLVTGDMGRIDAEGYITLLGRRSNIINRGAYKIYALEIEEALRGIDGVLDAAVVGVPHPLLGEDILAFVCGREGVQPRTLLGSLRQRLPSFKIPTLAYLVESLPRNRIGKVLKDELLKMRQSTIGARTAALSGEALEQHLCKLAATLFNLAPALVTSRFSRDSNPQWDSLGHVQLVAAVEEELGVDIDDHSASAVRSISDLAKLVEYLVHHGDGSTNSNHATSKGRE